MGNNEFQYQISISIFNLNFQSEIEILRLKFNLNLNLRLKFNLRLKIATQIEIEIDENGQKIEIKGSKKDTHFVDLVIKDKEDKIVKVIFKNKFLMKIMYSISGII